MHCRGTKRTQSMIMEETRSEYEATQSFRNYSIQKWDDKTRLAVMSKDKKSSDIQQTVLHQIEHVSSRGLVLK